jgi:hypothetical protein
MIAVSLRPDQWELVMDMLDEMNNRLAPTTQDTPAARFARAYTRKRVVETTRDIRNQLETA